MQNKNDPEAAIPELRLVISESVKGNDFSLSFHGFLDVFYSFQGSKEKMYALIQNEPEQFENVPEYQYAMCAAAANKMANDYDLEVPDWIWKDQYYMTEMYFGNVRKGRLRMYNMLYSPAEFKYRGLFVDENILKRV